MAFATERAEFTGAEDYVDITFDERNDEIGFNHGVTPTDGSGPIVVWLTSPTSTSVRVNVSDRFTGYVDVTIYDRP